MTKPVLGLRQVQEQKHIQIAAAANTLERVN